MELIDTSRPEIAKAIELARQLVEHCDKHNFSDQAEIFGVAINADKMKEFFYLKGREDEKKLVTIELTLKQLDTLCEKLIELQDEWPSVSGWASDELSELRALVGNKLDECNGGSRVICRKSGKLKNGDR